MFLPTPQVRTVLVVTATSPNFHSLPADDCYTEGFSGGIVNITYVVFPSYDEASAAGDEYVRAMAGTGKHRSQVGQSRLCVLDATTADECTAVSGNVMVRVLSRLKASGLADEAHTEEMMDLALAHLRVVKSQVSL